MTSTTITEALAELKTIAKRLEKKQQFVNEYLYRQEHYKDPLEKQGGSVSSIRAERQAIGDLQERVISIRREIARANAETTITVREATRPIADWLVWRRDIAPQLQSHLQTMRASIQRVREQARQKGLNVTMAEATKPSDVIVNVDEQALAQEAEDLETTLGTLDGLLSLKNATVVIDI